MGKQYGRSRERLRSDVLVALIKGFSDQRADPEKLYVAVHDFLKHGLEFAYYLDRDEQRGGGLPDALMAMMKIRFQQTAIALDKLAGVRVTKRRDEFYAAPKKKGKR